MNRSTPPTLRRRSLPVMGLAAAAVTGIVPAAGAVPSAPASPTLEDPAEVLRRMRVPQGAATTAGPVWSPRATGFAGVATDSHPRGTVGGLGARPVTVRSAAELTAALLAPAPRILLVDGRIDLPFGTMVDIPSRTSILGLGTGAEIVGGGFRLPSVDDVILRNLLFRDSFIAGDWDGKSEENDNDGIRVDTSDHIWIDHCEFARLGDGQVDIRKDSTHVTVSWCLLRDHDKTLGVGWTDNVLTTLTIHHTRFSNTHQRNGSIDNVALCHVHCCWLEGVSSYGMASRGASQLLVEHSVFDTVRNPIGVSDPESRVAQNGNLREGCWGSWEDTSIDLDPADCYDYALDPVEEVRSLLTRHAGPHGSTERVPRRIDVAQDGSGDVLSVHAAVGAAARAAHPVEIRVHPGTYREVVTVWPGAEGLVIRGATGRPEDVVLTYDKPADDWATLTVLAPDVTLAALTLENAFERADGDERPAAPLRSADDSLRLQDVRLVGGEHWISDPRD
ncbi:pectate lyase [Brachybacterium sp. NBEC-018]|uniref:pectate lyase family protein n=1 Tax=Brachybacterium sp. NBEC-018 TaxID=2996004 RepID=UPI002174FF18|nr:pectate lyase [Brachybacterium sp. NBEC-018]UVY84967.1 pectate lyase [Brachybacterium sp. NBEC-018]